MSNDRMFNIAFWSFIIFVFVMISIPYYKWLTYKPSNMRRSIMAERMKCHKEYCNKSYLIINGIERINWECPVVNKQEHEKCLGYAIY